MHDQPITDTKEANDVLQDLYKAAYNNECVVARGRVRIPFIMPGFALVIHRLQPAPDQDVIAMGNKGTIYSASFLRQLADVANLRVIQSHRVDGRGHPFLREFECIVMGMDLLMRQRQSIGTYELDLRDGSPRIDGIRQRAQSPADGDKKCRDLREHITSRAETGAYARAVVEALAIARAYKKTNIANVAIYVPSMELHAATASPAMLQDMAFAAVQAQMGAFGVPQSLPAPVSHPAVLPAPADVPDDEPPFMDDIPVDDGPPAEPDPPPVDEFVTEQQKAELKALGCWKQDILKSLGWSGDGGVPVAVYRKAMAQYGGQQ